MLLKLFITVLSFLKKTQWQIIPGFNSSWQLVFAILFNAYFQKEMLLINL